MAGQSCSSNLDIKRHQIPADVYTVKHKISVLECSFLNEAIPCTSQS